MPKIRDLGINVIPVTMRPLEIGPGTAFDLNAACRGETCTQSSGQCVPTCKPPSVCAANTSKKYEAAGFTDGAIAQLRQQLYDSIRN